MACNCAIVVVAGISSRRQISGLIPAITTRSWQTFTSGQGAMSTITLSWPASAPPAVYGDAAAGGDR